MLFHEAQYGSRPNKSTTDVILFKHLTYGIWRLTKTDAASFDNDAKACYDRIVMLFGSLCSRRMGMPKQACKLLTKTLQAAHYHVMTPQGLSDSSYGNTLFLVWKKESTTEQNPAAAVASTGDRLHPVLTLVTPHCLPAMRRSSKVDLNFLY